MTAFEQLRHLARMFPSSRELAVSPELRDSLIEEVIANQRYCASDNYKPFVFVTEVYPTITATRLSIAFRDRRLTLVEAR